MKNIYSYPFPGVVLSGRQQYDDYRASHSNLLDYRYSFEQSLASEKAVAVAGICPLTLEHTTFVSDIAGGERRADGRTVPNWKSAQRCANNINMSQRAVAHYALYCAPEAGLGNVLVVDDNNALDYAIKPYAEQIDFCGPASIPTKEALYDTILAFSVLQSQRDLPGILKRLSRLLKPGGAIYFGMNFHYGDAESRMHDMGGQVYWALGWDFVDELTEAGLRAPQAVTFWAVELGYLGPSNLIFEARK